MDKISVIVPAYKVEAYLHRCIDSILGQSYENFELILVEDGSPDRCGEICDEYAQRDCRVHVIHQKNAGVSVARNNGIEWALKNSDSQWIAFIDSDDWIHREYLMTLYGMTQNHNVQIAMCGYQSTSDFTQDTAYSGGKTIVLTPEDAFVQHYEKCMPPWCKLIRKSLMKDLRFPVGVRYEDACITHILTLSANQIAVCPEQLYYYFCNSESFTRSRWTEACLVGIQFHEQRLAYLLENGYCNAYQREQEFFLEILTGNLQGLMYLIKEDASYETYFRQIQRKHRALFADMKVQGRLGFRWETMWYYFFAAQSDLIWKTAGWAQKIYHTLKR